MFTFRLSVNLSCATCILYLVLGVSLSSSFSFGGGAGSGTRTDEFFFTSESGKRSVADGERKVILECRVSNSQNVQFKWYQNGEMVENTTRRYQVGSDLFISRILHEYDSGDFVCIATNFNSGLTLTNKPIALNIIWITPEASVHLMSPERMVDVKPGVDVVLKCAVEGTSEVTFQWFRDEKALERSERVAFHGKKVHVHSVTSEDNGAYTCKAKNDASEAASAGKLHLVVADEKVPKIVIPPKDQIVKKNGHAQFDCVFEKNALTQWFFNDDGPLANSSRYTLYSNGTLMIHRIRAVEEGIYKCLGNFVSYPEKEPQIYSAFLRVAYLEPLKNTSLDPAPFISGHKLALPENGKAEIFCDKPKGLPVPRLWWEGPNGKLISNLTSPDFRGIRSARVRDSYVLIIDRVRPELAGNYTCIADNTEGITRTYFQLITTSPPSILGHPLSTIAEEGEIATFVCQVKKSPDFPISRIQWLRNLTPIPGESKSSSDLMSTGDDRDHSSRIQNHEHNVTLVINPVLLTDAGEYTCEIITSGFPPVRSRPAQLFVKEMLKFMPKPIDRRLELGSNSKMHCKAHGIPPPIVRWAKVWEGQPMFKWPSHIQDQNGTLYFQDVQKYDSGKYTCIATNAQGFINTTIYVDVIVSPKFSVSPRNPTEAVEGHAVMIQCKADGDPVPTIQWDKDNIMNGFDQNRFQVMDNGSLLITEVILDDVGRYGCTAGNSGGFKREEVRLLVRTNDDFISESLDNANIMTRTVSITLSVAAGYMLLVIGLMLWCRYRQLRRKQAYLAEIRKESGDAEMKDANPVCNGNGTLLIGNGHAVKSESCRDSVKSDGETGKSSHSSTKVVSATASVSSHRSQVSQNSKRSVGTNYDKISSSRGDLQFVMLLGHGDFGEVFLAKAKNVREGEEESLVMVKALQTREEAALFEFKRELDMYHKLSQDNVTRLVRLCREMDPHYMIMEYSDWGDLKQFLLATRKDHPRTPKPPLLTMSQIVQVISQVAIGMEHLSNHRFVHKDLATRNCLISSGLKIQVSNPSLCRDTYANEYYKYKNQIVPIRWLPYEAAVEDDFSTKSDVWAFGCLIWEVVHQAAIPFTNLTNEAIVEYLERKELRWNSSEMEELVPKSLLNLLSQCWDPCPRNRPSFSSIVISLGDISREDFEK